MTAQPSILFVHENHPAQFGALADHLAARGWRVVFATQAENVPEGRAHTLPSGVSLVRYSRARDVNPAAHRYLVGTERAVLNGQAFARLGASLQKGGFTPDIVVAHSGWGSGSFAKVVWPQARLVQYLEWWYSYPPVDVGPDWQQRAVPEDESARALVRNLPFLLDFQQADLVVAPTRFQARQAPDFIRDRMVVQHDGVDCRRFRPADDDAPRFALDGLPDDAPIVTFATRGMEPARGFPTFMAAASRLHALRKDVHVVVAGNDKAHYGPEPDGYRSWKERMLAEHPFDPARIHFTGLMPKPRYASLLQRSAAHAYLTQPFVLSWSLIESMASAAPIVATDVEPVREALGRGDTARRVPQGDPGAVLSQILWCLDHPGMARAMGLRARERALAEYDIPACHGALEGHFRNLLPDVRTGRRDRAQRPGAETGRRPAQTGGKPGRPEAQRRYLTY